ncbi:MAG: hydrogenase maturation nickel metallochaperone HypA [Myxococcota bacterium]
MHEVSLVHALFDQADRAIAPRPAGAVRALTVRIGAQAGVDPELFKLAFEGCKLERGYGGAALAIVLERAIWRCAGCGAPVEDGEVLACAACAGEVRLSQGGDLVLDRLELEVSDV